MNVTLPDGKELELQDGATGADAARAIGEGLARAALAIKVNGDLRDLSAPLNAGEPFERTDVSAEEAIELFKNEGQSYKVELIEDLGEPTVSLYRNGPFTDLCRGPHGPSTKRIKAFKLMSTAGAYWRGDSSKPMLTRIYGTAFFSKDDLDAYLERLEQARARDHRKLGKELGLFMFSELAPGLPFWQPAGTQVWNELTTFWRRENVARGYTEVRTPLIYDVDLWKQSGHWDKFRDNMYFTDVEG